jgi:hypothetical protein
MIQGAPPDAQRDPQGYYYWLVSNGFPPDVAYDEMVKVFGPPKTQEELNKEAADREQRNNLAQVGGVVAGTAATGWVMDGMKMPEFLKSKPPVTPPPTNTLVTPSAGAPTGSPTSSPGFRSGAEMIGNGVNTPTPVVEVGSVTMPDGTPGKLMSDGGKIGENGKIVNPDGGDGGSIRGEALAGLQIAGGAAQAYNGYRQYQGGEKLGGAANMAGGAYTAAAGIETLAAGGTAGALSEYLPAVGTAVAAAQIGQNMLSDKGSSEDRAAKSQAEAQKAALLWIPGYGWVAYAALSGLDAVTGGKASEALMKYNKFSNKVTDKIDFGLGKNIRGRVFHQSTKGRQEERTGQLLQQSDDPNWQNYVASMRMQQIKEGPKDKTKPFFKGQYATFDEYKKAGLQADDLTGVYGNMDAFKPDYAEKAGLPNWANLTFEQRKAVTQRLIDEDMYSSKKGDIVIGDKEKARRIYEEMAKTDFKPSPMQGAPMQRAPNVPPASRPGATPPLAVQEALQQTNKKMSIGDVLRKNMKNKENYG